MRIVRIDAFQVSYGLLDQEYAWSNENAVSAFTSNIVRVKTDEGITGWGEVCPLGSTYMPSYAKGVPAAIAEYGPALIGRDPREIKVINHIMDRTLSGHGYAKSPVDIACWDILGKTAGQSVAVLLGGRFVESYPPYRAISQGPPEAMAEDVAKYREKGYHRFQLKVGGDLSADIARTAAVLDSLEEGEVLVADANTGWISSEAIRLANALRDRDFIIEQPCATYDESLRVRQNVPHAFNLDEVIDSFEALRRGIADGAMDGVNLKISRWGGLTKACMARDMCEQAGLVMTLEDSWGGDITSAAISAFVGSTRPEFYLSSTDFDSYIDLHVAPDAPRMRDGLVDVPNRPGLGVTVDEALLGDPVLTVE